MYLLYNYLTFFNVKQFSPIVTKTLQMYNHLFLQMEVLQTLVVHHLHHILPLIIIVVVIDSMINVAFYIYI